MDYVFTGNRDGNWAEIEEIRHATERILKELGETFTDVVSETKDDRVLAHFINIASSVSFETQQVRHAYQLKELLRDRLIRAYSHIAAMCQSRIEELRK